MKTTHEKLELLGRVVLGSFYLLMSVFFLLTVLVWRGSIDNWFTIGTRIWLCVFSLVNAVKVFKRIWQEREKNSNP